MKQLVPALFVVGAIMALTGAAVFITGWIYAPYIYTIGAAGFCIYGPQALVGIAAANIATKKAAATAVGFTGLFGYASTLVSGWGLGLLAQHYGWNIAVGALILIAIMGTLIFMAAWSAKANGYDND